jgi:hypothetical protein
MGRSPPGWIGGRQSIPFDYDAWMIYCQYCNRWLQCASVHLVRLHVECNLHRRNKLLAETDPTGFWGEEGPPPARGLFSSGVPHLKRNR